MLLIFISPFQKSSKSMGGSKLNWSKIMLFRQTHIRLPKFQEIQKAYEQTNFRTIVMRKWLSHAFSTFFRLICLNNQSLLQTMAGRKGSIASNKSSSSEFALPVSSNHTLAVPVSGHLKLLGKVLKLVSIVDRGPLAETYLKNPCY